MMFYDANFKIVIRKRVGKVFPSFFDDFSVRMEIEKFFVSLHRDGENCLRGREIEGNARRTQIDIDE